MRIVAGARLEAGRVAGQTAGGIPLGMPGILKHGIAVRLGMHAALPG